MIPRTIMPRNNVLLDFVLWMEHQLIDLLNEVVTNRYTVSGNEGMNGGHAPRSAVLADLQQVD